MDHYQLNVFAWNAFVHRLCDLRFIESKSEHKCSQMLVSLHFSNDVVNSDCLVNVKRVEKTLLLSRFI